MTRCEKMRELQQKAMKNIVAFADDKNLHDFWANAFSGINIKLASMTIAELSEQVR